jgi:hypothetical protein
MTLLNAVKQLKMDPKYFKINSKEKEKEIFQPCRHCNPMLHENIPLEN